MNKKFLAISHMVAMLVTLDGAYAAELQPPTKKVLVPELYKSAYGLKKSKQKIFKGQRFVCSSSACGANLVLATDCALNIFEKNNESRLEKNCMKAGATASAAAAKNAVGVSKEHSLALEAFFKARTAAGNINAVEFAAVSPDGGSALAKFKKAAIDLLRVEKSMAMPMPSDAPAPVVQASVDNNAAPMNNSAPASVDNSNDSASKQVALGNNGTRFHMHSSQEDLREILQQLEDLYGHQVENQSDEKVVNLIISNTSRLHHDKPLRVDAATVSAVVDRMNAINDPQYSEQDKKAAYHILKLFVAFILDKTRIWKNGKIVNFTDVVPDSAEAGSLVKVHQLGDFQIDDKWITFLTRFQNFKKALAPRMFAEKVISDDVATSRMIAAPMAIVTPPPSYEEAMRITPEGPSSSAVVKYNIPQRLEELYGNQVVHQTDKAIVRAIEAQARTLNGKFPELLSGQSLTAVLKNMEQLALMAEKGEKQSMGLHALKLLVALMQDRTRTVENGKIVDRQLSIEDTRKRWSGFLNTLADTSSKAIEAAPYATYTAMSPDASASASAASAQL